MTRNSYDFTKQPSVVLQGAMETETAYLISRLEDTEQITFGSWRFVTGFLGKYREPVIVSRTFQGMVNAAAATCLALEHFAPRAVINQGIAGGHDTSFHRGDIVLGERVVPYGAAVRPFSPAGAGICETDFEQLAIEAVRGGTGVTEKVTEYMCDRKLLDLAMRAADASGGEKEARRIAVGVLGSADEWNNQIDRIALLRERYHTSSEDMETAAAAQICYSYGVPFLGIRIISNSIVNEEAYDEAVSEDCQRFVLNVVESIHREP